jgi:iron complex outermembrane receptor protein
MSQKDTTSHYDGLSLKDLLELKIVSVSKNPEFLFDAALSASVVTKEEIQRTGCTSIMEALRLVPGIIVRQQTNGNYDIHLRGMDNVPLNASFDIASTTTLVMINNRPIYSYLRGGTFWETLPVDINDVEKIEVVRGPAGAMYGPNAVNGVINIITREPVNEGLYIVANAIQGSDQTFVNNISAGIKKEKWSLIASANYQRRNRSQNSYFEFNRNQWFENSDLLFNFNNDTVRNLSIRNPYPELAMEKYAGNIFLSYNPTEKINLDISAGTQHSLVQKVSAENELTPLSTALSASNYVDLRVKAGNLSAQFSHNCGQQIVDHDPGNKFDFAITDANIEYNFRGKNFEIKPGMSFRNAIYDDRKYSDLSNKAGIFNGKGNIRTITASIRAEYSLIPNKLKLIGGLAADKFNFPNKTYFAAQLATTYKINNNHIVRAVFSQTPRSSNIFDTYVDQTVVYYPSGYQQFTRMGLVGNKDLKLLTAYLIEFGYRGKLSPRMNIDVEIFDIRAGNTNLLVTSAPYQREEGNNVITEIPIVATNLPLKFHQQGITVSLAYSTPKFQIKPFLTLQKSMVSDYAPYHNTPDAGMGPNNINSGIGTKQAHRSTPARFGGLSINYVPTSRINANISSYVYSKQSYSHLSNVLLNDGIRGRDEIKGKIIVNASVSYEPIRDLHFFISGKNILNNTSREFFKADKIPAMLLGGINYQF